MNASVSEVVFMLINDVFVKGRAAQYAGRLVSTPRTETQHTKISRRHILAMFHCHLSAIT
jgi:hypothetical protein